MIKRGMVLIGMLAMTTAFADSKIPTKTKISVDYSYVTITNNTDENIQVGTTLTTSDTSFTRGKDWDETSTSLAPYESKQILWFSRNTDVRANQQYQFNIVAEHNNDAQPVVITFNEKGKAIFGSELSTELALPDSNKQSILAQNDFQQLSGFFWGKTHTIYARTWLPVGNLFNNYQIVINQLEDNTFDTNSNQKISVLTYNTQLMPFYSGIVDDLNQPNIRVQDIPNKISQYDVVILEELFDHDLRNTITQLMQAHYPFHTQVVGDGTSKVLTGGVMIFSKWPIQKENQIVYQASAGADSLAAKGAVLVTINKNGKIYHIIGTHLQADDDEVDAKVRQQQLQELANFIDRMNIPYDEPLLIGGDFNIDQFGKEANTLFDIAHVNLSDNVGYRYSFDGLLDTMAVDHNRMRIDYVFYSNLHVQPKTALNKVFVLRDFDNEKMWPKFDLSDHFPTASYFDFS